jgi:uncharacterized lipoprotein
MEHAQIALSADKSELDWSSDATELAYSNEIMFAMLNYLGRGDIASTAPTLSQFQTDDRLTATMGRDSRNRPLLNVKTSGDQAWELVNLALDSAGVDVGTRDREAGVIYLTFKQSVAQEKPQGFFEWLRNREVGPITINTDLLTSKINKNQPKDISYSSDPDAIVSGAQATQEELQAMEGFKVWMGGRVVYVFGQDNQKRLNDATGELELFKRFQLSFNRARTGVLLTVNDDKGKPADAGGAEQLLWLIKDNLPL